ncbi:hypothetical protein Tco_0550800 [Tanacetum coccineum]
MHCTGLTQGLLDAGIIYAIKDSPWPGSVCSKYLMLFVFLLARASIMVTFSLPLFASILCDGGTDSGNDGESGLDLLRDEDGNSNESSGNHMNDGATLYRFMVDL